MSLKLKESLLNGSNQGSLHGLASFSPSPRLQDEPDINARMTALLDLMANTKNELKEYKKLIEQYRSEISGMQRAMETLNN